MVNKVDFSNIQWYHCILSSLMSSSFCTLVWKQQNVFISHFILGTTAFTAKCRFHFPLYLEDYCIFIKSSSFTHSYIRWTDRWHPVFKFPMSSSFPLKGPFLKFFPETHYSILRQHVLLRHFIFPWDTSLYF